MAKKIVLSDHALLKIQLLRKHGFQIDENLIEDVVTSPDKIEEGYRS